MIAKGRMVLHRVHDVAHHTQHVKPAGVCLGRQARRRRGQGQQAMLRELAQKGAEGCVAVKCKAMPTAVAHSQQETVWREQSGPAHASLALYKDTPRAVAGHGPDNIPQYPAALQVRQPQNHHAHPPANSLQHPYPTSQLYTHRQHKHTICTPAHLDKMGSDRLMFSAKVLLGSYLPSSGLAAAITLQRACSCVTMPALLIEIDCCSMAS